MKDIGAFVDGSDKLRALVRFAAYLTIHTTSYIKDLEVVLTSKYEGKEEMPRGVSELPGQRGDFREGNLPRLRRRGQTRHYRRLR